jgi:cyclopropane-fatty-acyl-phospholipid synthase
MHNFTKTKAIKMFAKADIKIDGNREWDIQVHDERFYSSLLFHGSVALGETYVNGWWDCKNVEQFIYRVLHYRLVNPRTYELQHFGSSFLKNTRFISKYIINAQSVKRASRDVKYHYNLGNDLFRATLGQSMTYTCGYFKNTKDLDEAQLNKMDLVCKKLHLKKGMTVLDIGCGWGSLAKHMSSKYGVKVVGITLSENQVKYARRHCKGEDVKIVLCDYRDYVGKFDRIVSIEMIEHVGAKNLKEFMHKANANLKEDGLMLLQFDGKAESINWNYSWIEKYIFPGTVTPSLKQITTSAEGLFTLVDLHDFTKDYHLTMNCWHSNFLKNWDDIKDSYDDRFFRLWKFYLTMCPATALANTQHLWQIVLQKNNSEKQYERIC